jgi:uncharacterized protein (TIGR04551 family)
MRILFSWALAAGILFASGSYAQDSSSPAAAEEQSDKKKQESSERKPDEGKTEESTEVDPKDLLHPKTPENEAAPLPPGFVETTIKDEMSRRPPMNLVDLHGYFRVRGDLDKRVDLGLKPRELYPQFPRSATNRASTMAGANMRFRLEPTLNIREDVRIMSQIDMLDNLILGSTPDSFPRNGYASIAAFSEGQEPPMEGYNALKDSILVKRIWGEVKMPLGILRFGRMGAHWGLGMLANDGGPSFVDRGPLVTQKDPFSPVGQCFDCDYGNTADRILFVTKFAGHYFVPMVGFASEGPYFSRKNELGGQPIDLDQLDDVSDYAIAIYRQDKPEDLQQALLQNDWVLNYGLYFIYRNQALDAVEYTNSGDVSLGSGQTVDQYAVRNADLYITDLWVRFLWQKLRIELEVAGVFGKIGYDTLSASLNADGNLDVSRAGTKMDLQQFGAVLQGDYSWMNDQLIFGMEVGFASGDDKDYFGVRPLEQGQLGDGTPVQDRNIKNFRFNFDYHVDMILWREIVGTVTDALYVKPNFQYNISENFGFKFSAIYSMAVYKESTRGKEHPLGLELNADLFFFSGDNFHAGISYGILFPFSGMKDLGNDKQPGGISSVDKDSDPSIAHRILGRLVLYF